MKLTTPRLLQASLILGGLAAGSFCVYAAFDNGRSLTSDATGGRMFGLALAAVVFISWLMLPVADWREAAGKWFTAWSVRAMWLATLGFVILSSAFYAASHRVDMVESKGIAIDAYERAKADRATAEADLSGMKKSELWAASASCAAIGDSYQKKFCAKVEAAKASIVKAEAVLAKGKPGAKDAGAESVAWLLAGDADKVGKAWPVYLGLVVELAASFCMKFAFLVGEKPAPVAEAEPQPEPAQIEAAPAQVFRLEQVNPASALAMRRWHPELEQAVIETPAPKQPRRRAKQA
jgi:hypothetical protein